MMEKQKKKDGPGVKRRQKILLEKYNELYQEAGEHAPLLAKSYFYDRLADATGYSPTTIQIYIGRALKGNE